MFIAKAEEFDLVNDFWLCASNSAGHMANRDEASLLKLCVSQETSAPEQGGVTDGTSTGSLGAGGWMWS